MFKSLKNYKHIVLTGNISDNILSCVLEHDKYKITDNFEYLDDNCMIYNQEVNTIPFDKLNLTDFFFITNKDDFPFDKVPYCYQELSNITNFIPNSFKFYHQHLDNKKVLHFENKESINFDIFSTTKDVRFIPQKLKKIEYHAILPHLPSGFLLFFYGTKISDYLEKDFLLRYETLELGDTTYLLVFYGNKVFPFRFKGKADFITRYYKLKNKEIFKIKS